jgi:hypothetical protein
MPGPNDGEDQLPAGRTGEAFFGTKRALARILLRVSPAISEQ